LGNALRFPRNQSSHHEKKCGHQRLNWGELLGLKQTLSKSGTHVLLAIHSKNYSFLVFALNREAPTSANIIKAPGVTTATANTAESFNLL